MLTSLVAVIPGAFLIYLLVLAMLFSENLPMMAYVVMGGTLLASVVTVLIPAGVLLGGNRKPAPAKSPKQPATLNTSGDIEALDEGLEVLDEPIESSGEDGLVIGTSEFDLGVSDEENEVQTMADESEIETEKVDEVEEFEAFELDEDAVEDFDLDEEPKAKKKK